MFDNRVLLVTGGTGSFGNAVLRRFLEDANPRDPHLQPGREEAGRHAAGVRQPQLKFYIGDVRNQDSLRDAMAGVDYVFHAAALKQVPSCEFYPMEALRTNALGAENVLNAAVGERREARRRPEHRQGGLSDQRHGHLQGDDGEADGGQVARGAGDGTVICGTRYGNVMASRGSVIPLFIKQIQEGPPLTVTDPGMTRFMMSIEDAVDLVLYAFQHAAPGDIFVQKAPAATIETLAAGAQEGLQGRQPVKVIGTRHGEKLYETLLTREEMGGAEDLRRLLPHPRRQPRPELRGVLLRGQRRDVAEGRLPLAQHPAARRGRDGGDAA